MAINCASRTKMIRRVTALAFSSCVLADLSAAADQTIRIVTEEWAPYNYSDDGKLKGFSVEIVRALASALNTDIDIQMLPSMRAAAVLQSQRRTMLITMLRTPEREAEYKWVGPLGDSSIYFYKRKGDPLPISTLADAKKARSICSRHSGLAFSRLKLAGFTNLDAVASEGGTVYRMLIFGRCDLAVSDSPLGVNYLLKKMDFPPDAITQTPVKLVESPIYIACSKDMSDSEISRWQKALDQMKKSGAFQTIVQKYSD